nr:uncharacterized protein LOC129267245 [Lytechinus pictus]
MHDEKYRVLRVPVHDDVPYSGLSLVELLISAAVNLPYGTEFELPSTSLFPADAATRQLWLEYLQRDGFVPTSTSVICSEHFKKVCFQPKSGTHHPQLRYGAVPTLFSRQWNTKVVGKEEEDDKSSDGERESWSRWHSLKDKNGSTTADGQTDASKGLQEMQELMDEDEDDDGDLSDEIEVVEDDDEDSNDEREEMENDEREKVEDSRKEALEDRTRVASRSSGVVQPDVPAKNGTTQSALDVIRRSDKITLDTVTMDASLSAVKVGNQKMISLTFQDVLNSLITPQESDSSAGHKESSGSTPTSSKVTGHQNTDNQDVSSQSKGWTAVEGKATQQSLITPELLKSLKESERTKGKDKKGKRTKTGRKGKMVISIYRKNSMIRVISSKDLPYMCGNCGSAFTHASVLKEHVESKHNYYEPLEINTSEIVSEVVTHREFLKKNLKTKDQVKELQKMYPKPESSAVSKGSEPRWFEKVEQSNSPIPVAESEVDDPIGDDASDLGDDQDVGGDSPREIPGTKKRKRKKPYKKRHKERCHRCPVVFTTLAQRKQHLTEVHSEFQTREDANNMWKSKTGMSADEIFKCLYCDTYFISAEDAEGHLNKHCGLDGTKCETCKGRNCCGMKEEIWS